MSESMPDYPVTPDDVLVVKKSTIIATGVAIVFFLAGGTTGYFAGLNAFNQGGTLAITNALNEGLAQAPSGQAQAPAAPAPPAARLDDVDVDDDPALGAKNAPVTIVEFSDFECPFCARYFDTTHQQLLDEYGDQIRFVYRDFPLSSIHSRAQPSAEAAECADDQDAFWDYHDLLFTNQFALDNQSLISYANRLDLDVDTFTECLESGKHTDEVLADFEAGREYGVTGTPTFFINGVRVVGAQPFQVFKDIIEEELANS